MKTEVLPVDSQSFLRIAEWLCQDQVVALPTETVYGLAGNAFRDEAIQKIFLAKTRPAFDPLIVHISECYLAHPSGTIQALVDDGIIGSEILSSPELQRLTETMKRFWPGPLTFILPRGARIPDSVTASQSTVGIRCPAHPAFQAVLASVAFPLAAPSANRFGRISPTEASHVFNELNGKIPAILDGGACEIGVESTILRIDLPFHATLLRPGKISGSELERILQTSVSTGKTLGELSHPDITPGSLDEHYAPIKPLYLFPFPFSETKKLNEFLRKNILPEKLAFLSMHTPFDRAFEDAKTPLKSVRYEVLSTQKSLDEVARLLFRALRKLDCDPATNAILADLPENLESGIATAIADRLRRASKNKPTF